MKLARSAVFAVSGTIKGNVAFLYINSKGDISPFWRSGGGQWRKHGELDLHYDGQYVDHNHWRGVEDLAEIKITMIQSHVTRAEYVDFKRALKFAKKH